MSFKQGNYWLQALYQNWMTLPANIQSPEYADQLRVTHTKFIRSITSTA